jgi:SRSO17 transposase
VFRSWGKRPPVAGTAADIARTRRSSDWKRLSAGAGTKGPRLHGWHRHVSLVMLAFAMMAAIRHRANPPPPKKTNRRPPAKVKTLPRRH